MESNNKTIRRDKSSKRNNMVRSMATTAVSNMAVDEEHIGPPRKLPRRKDGRIFVEKNSLSEEALLAERDRVRARLRDSKKGNDGEVVQEDLIADRRAANRLSAFQSRQRRKTIIEDLQKTVAELARHNAEQANMISDLKGKISKIENENDVLRNDVSVAASGAVSLPDNNNSSNISSSKSNNNTGNNTRATTANEVSGTATTSTKTSSSTSTSLMPHSGRDSSTTTTTTTTTTSCASATWTNPRLQHHSGAPATQDANSGGNGNEMIQRLLGHQNSSCTNGNQNCAGDSSLSSHNNANPGTAPTRTSTSPSTITQSYGPGVTDAVPAPTSSANNTNSNPMNALLTLLLAAQQQQQQPCQPQQAATNQYSQGSQVFQQGSSTTVANADTIQLLLALQSRLQQLPAPQVLPDTSRSGLGISAVGPVSQQQQQQQCYSHQGYSQYPEVPEEASDQHQYPTASVSTSEQQNAGTQDSTFSSMEDAASVATSTNAYPGTLAQFIQQQQQAMQPPMRSSNTTPLMQQPQQQQDQSGDRTATRNGGNFDILEQLRQLLKAREGNSPSNPT